MVAGKGDHVVFLLVVSDEGQCRPLRHGSPPETPTLLASDSQGRGRRKAKKGACGFLSICSKNRMKIAYSRAKLS